MENSDSDLVGVAGRRFALGESSHREYVKRGSIEEDNGNKYQVLCGWQGRDDGWDRNPRSLFYRVSEYSGGNGGEGDGMKLEFVRHTHGFTIATCQNLRLTSTSTVPNWTDGMNHILCWQIAGCRRHCLPRRERPAFSPDTPALRCNGRPARAMDRSTHTAPGQQLRVGGIDDGIGAISCDVVADQPQFSEIAEPHAHQVFLVARQICSNVAQELSLAQPSLEPKA